MNKPSSLEPYELQITVQASDIDKLGHVNNVVYLQWVQTAATTHWYATATAQQKAAYLWVVAKHEIEYKRPAMEGDVLLIRTWVGKATHRLFTRHTEVLRKTDGKLVAKAVSLWAPVDFESKTPVKPSQDVYDMFSVES